MSAEAVSSASSYDPAPSLDRLRLRLVDAAADLRPAAGPPLGSDVWERIAYVEHELDAIIRDLRALYQVKRLESTGLEERLQVIDRQLAEGWQPDGKPVDQVIDQLRSSLEQDTAG